MTEAVPMVEKAIAVTPAQAAASRLKQRYAAERRFKALGISAIVLALGFLALLLVTILSNGLTAFVQTNIRVDVTLDAETLGVDPVKPSADALAAANYGQVIKNAMYKAFPTVESRPERRQLAALVSSGADVGLRKMLVANPQPAGQHAKHLAGRRRRCRHGHEGAYHPHGRGRGQSSDRRSVGLAGRVGKEGRRRQEVQHRPVHRRRLA
uniref:ABC-type phosphate transport system, permease component n=1 Tax=Magnetospirillum gryphiswaldense TaxID=55518 RepID=A4U2I6_9PROT|nr:ABC-type phosphate transport system, permease component [Magnetospirillum gryphiswaldense MSR-1]